MFGDLHGHNINEGNSWNLPFKDSIIFTCHIHLCKQSILLCYQCTATKMPLTISKYLWHALLPANSTPLITSRAATLDNAIQYSNNNNSHIQEVRV